jgi:hypothetical protein
MTNIPETFIVFTQSGMEYIADFSLLFHFQGLFLMMLILIYIRLGKRRR